MVSVKWGADWVVEDEKMDTIVDNLESLVIEEKGVGTLGGK